jgi:hypothetical protein
MSLHTQGNTSTRYAASHKAVPHRRRHISAAPDCIASLQLALCLIESWRHPNQLGVCQAMSLTDKLSFEELGISQQVSQERGRD